MTNQRTYHEFKPIGKGKAAIYLYRLDLPCSANHYVVYLQWWTDRLGDGPADEQSHLHRFVQESSAIRFAIGLFDDYTQRMELSQ